MYRERRVVFRALLGKPVGERPLGKPRCRWEDNNNNNNNNNNNMNLQEVGCGGYELDRSGSG